MIVIATQVKHASTYQNFCQIFNILLMHKIIYSNIYRNKMYLAKRIATLSLIKKNVNSSLKLGTNHNC